MSRPARPLVALAVASLGCNPIASPTRRGPWRGDSAGRCDGAACRSVDSCAHSRRRFIFWRPRYRVRRPGTPSASSPSRIARRRTHRRRRSPFRGPARCRPSRSRKSSGLSRRPCSAPPLSHPSTGAADRPCFDVPGIDAVVLYLHDWRQVNQAIGNIGSWLAAHEFGRATSSLWPQPMPGPAYPK
jgi:hypothetical protein